MTKTRSGRFFSFSKYIMLEFIPARANPGAGLVAETSNSGVCRWITRDYAQSSSSFPLCSCHPPGAHLNQSIYYWPDTTQQCAPSSVRTSSSLRGPSGLPYELHFGLLDVFNSFYGLFNIV